jgi:hypothetical protein
VPGRSIGPGAGSRPAAGRIDHEPGAAASALLIKHGESAARENRAAQRERVRELARALASLIVVLTPTRADEAIGRQRATRYPAPICPHPQATRGPPSFGRIAA